MRIQVSLIWWANFDSNENGRKKKAFLENQSTKAMYPKEKNIFIVKSQKEERLSWETKFVPFDGWILILRKMVEIKAFLPKAKHQSYVSRWKKHVYCAQSQKEFRLSWESRFIPFFGWTLILRKIMEIKAYIATPMHQNHASLWQEYVYCVQLA